MTVTTSGTGSPVTLGTAVQQFLTFAQAGVADGDTVLYSILDGANGGEVGWGVYTASGTTLTRNVIKSTNSNAAISLSGAAQVAISPLAADGGDLLVSTLNPMRGFDAPINLKIAAAVASNILTVTLSGNNGSAFSQTNPLLVPFRNSTAANGDPVWASATSALTIATVVGGTFGAANSAPFRLWIVLFNNAGTIVPALINCWKPNTNIFPLDETQPQTTVAMTSGSTSAGVFYTPAGTTLTTKSFRIVGFLEYSAGLATAGTFGIVPTNLTLFGPGVKKPGDVVQRAYGASGTQTSTTSSTATSTNVTANITPTSTCNVVEYEADGALESNANAQAGLGQMFRGSTGIGSSMESYYDGTGHVLIAGNGLAGIDAPNSISAQTYTVKIKNTDNATTIVYPGNTGGMRLKELMV